MRRYRALRSQNSTLGLLRCREAWWSGLATSARDRSLEGLMHLIVRGCWESVTSSSRRLRTSRVVILMHSGALVVNWVGSSSKVLLTKGWLSLGRRADGIRGVAWCSPCRGKLSILIHVAWCLRTLGTPGIDAGKTGAQAITGSWRRGQNTGRRRDAAIWKGTRNGRVRRRI